MTVTAVKLIENMLTIMKIKTGVKVPARDRQAAVFYKGGQFADILTEGTHVINK